ncbi:hypothetical protein WJX74_009702 [Apatococcus lobatus]|uniref:Uncharacterized protein n=1 Tax=Apatococcus lobatus TaxID=904363 RepID=A0AAW1QTN4_9CHLO
MSGLKKPARTAGADYEDSLMRDGLSNPLPWPIYKAIQALVWLLEYLLRRLTPPPIRMMKESWRGYDSAALGTIGIQGHVKLPSNGAIAVGPPA